MLFVIFLSLSVIILLFKPELQKILPSFIYEKDTLAFFLLTPIALFAIWCVIKGYDWIHAQFFSSIIIIFIMSLALFSNDFYGSLLRILRVGGGIEINILYTDDSNQILLKNQSLLLTTDKNLLIFDGSKKTGQISEIPTKNVISINYDNNPEWILPENSIKKQSQYINLDVLNSP